MVSTDTRQERTAFVFAGGGSLGAIEVGMLRALVGHGVQPDLVVVTAKNRALIGEAKLTGVPDLVVEILSPSRRRYDRRIKREKYERAGVPEFWIVDPEARCIEQYVLRDGKYGKPRLCTESIRLRVLRGVTIDLERVW